MVDRYVVVVRKRDDQITWYEIGDFSEPKNGQIAFLPGSDTNLKKNLTINGAKSDKFGKYIVFSTEEGSVIEM